MNSLEQLQQTINAKNGRIDELQLNLKHKDYIGTKIAMGRATKEDYATEIAQCDEWADEINTLTTEVTKLEAQKKALMAEMENASHEVEGGE